ncbi:MAG: VWA domain-containing protein [Thermoguttaceae bacterium]
MTDDNSMQYPAWLMSVLLHAAILAVFLLWWHLTWSPRGGVEEWHAIAGIVAVGDANRADAVEPPDEPNDDTAAAASAAANATETPTTPANSATEPLKTQSVIGASPSATMTQRTTESTSQGSSGAGDAAYNIGDSSRATVSVFGARGTGHRFVFILDRSESMKDSGARPFRAAREELIRAVDGLDEMHRVNVIAYNDEMMTLFPQMSSATDANRAAVRNFLKTLTPSGGTLHETPLVAAVKMNPDVVFLLTDATSDKDLSTAAYQRILQLLRTSQIHVIQFGSNASPQLERLTRATGGSFTQLTEFQ